MTRGFDGSKSGTVLTAAVLATVMLVSGACAPDRVVERVAAELVERVTGGNSFDRVIAGPGYLLTIERDGNYDLAADGSGVVALADGGYLEIHARLDGNEARIRFEDREDRIDRAFWIGDDPQVWDAAADRFVAQVMPILFRETLVDVTNRVAWLLEDGGDRALLDEIRLIRSDWNQRRFTEAYAALAAIPGPQFAELMALARNQIGSDSHLRETLLEVYRMQRPTGDQLVALLEAGLTIGSDSHARRFLEEIGSVLPDTDRAVSAYLDVAGTIGSDSHMRRALVQTAVRDDLSDRHVGQIIELAGRRIGSDSHLRRLLEAVAPRAAGSDELVRAYLDASRSIGSNNHERRALRALGAERGLTSSGRRGLL